MALSECEAPGMDEHSAEIEQQHRRRSHPCAGRQPLNQLRSFCRTPSSRSPYCSAAAALVELLQEPLLLLVQVARDQHAHQDLLVAPAVPVQMRHPLAAQHLDLARLGAGREGHLFVAVQGGDGQGGAQGRLHHGEVDAVEDVVVAPLEQLVLRHPHPHVQVAGPRPALARAPAARHPDALPGVDAGRDLHGDLALHERPAGAPALLAGRLDDLAAAPRSAGRAPVCTN